MSVVFARVGCLLKYILIRWLELFCFSGYNIWRRGWDRCYFVCILGYLIIPSNIVSLSRVFTLVVVAAMASPLLGAIREFQPSTKTFTIYSERLDQFFVANNIGSYRSTASEAVIAAAEKKKVSVMISVIGKKTSSWFVQSGESEREKIRAAARATSAAF